MRLDRSDAFNFGMPEPQETSQFASLVSEVLEWRTTSTFRLGKRRILICKSAELFVGRWRGCAVRGAPQAGCRCASTTVEFA